MISTSHLVVAARTVRIMAAMGALGLLVGYFAVAAFAGRYGTSTSMILDSKSNDTALSAAISAQEADGLTCSEKPTLTDVILFQRDGEAKVTILTFDEAIKASSAREGWIRRYCSAP